MLFIFPVPACGDSTFINLGVSVVYVDSNYSGDKFCGLNAVKKYGECGENCLWSY